MVRQKFIYDKSEQNRRCEPSGIVHKTPIVLLKRLNIPEDKRVIVKGESIIFEVDSLPSTESEEDDDVTPSNDYNIEDKEFRKLMVKRFQSTHGKNLFKNIDNFDTPISMKRGNPIRIGPKSYRSTNRIMSRTYSKPKSIAQSNALRRKTMKSYKSGKNAKHDSKKKQILMKDVAKKLLNSKDVEKKIENADTLNVNNSVKVEKDIIITPIDGKTLSRNRSFQSGKKKIIRNSNSIKNIPNSSRKQLINTDKNESDDSAQTVSAKENTGETSADSFSNVTPTSADDDNQINGKKNIPAIIDTPSRTSERIKNKKVKFSVLKLLAGGDPNILLRKERKTQKPPISKKTLIKSKTSEDGVVSNNLSNSKVTNRDIISDTKKSVGEHKSSKVIKKVTSNLAEVTDTNEDLSIENQEKPSSETVVQNNKEKKSSEIESKEVDKADKEDASLNSPNDKSTSEKPQKLNGTKDVFKSPSVTKAGKTLKKVGDKIKLQLQGTPEKKIVNISAQPSKEIIREKSRKLELKEKLQTALGPDIIIKRIRNDKTDEPEQCATLSNNLVVKNLIYTEQVPKRGKKAIKEVDIPPQIQKLIDEARKPTKSKESSTGNADVSVKSNTSFESTPNSITNKRKSRLGMKYNKKKMVTKVKKKSHENSIARSESEHELGADEGDDSDDDDDANTKESDGITKKLSHSALKNNIHNKDRGIKVGDTFSTNESGKKTAKVTPLRQVNKINPGEIIEKNYKQTTRFDESNSYCETKPSYKNSFDKYFSCTERICLHNDTLDSDSSEEVEFLSHFIDLNRKDSNRVNDECLNTTSLNEEEIYEIEDSPIRLGGDNVEEMSVDNPLSVNSSNRISGEKSANNIIKGTINEIISGVTAELPKWNWHILPDSSTVCLVLLDRGASGTLDVKKCVEIDCNFKANVYVDKQLINEYCGVYDDFEAIKNLIYQVDLL